jgi:DNA-binding NarL/FixJ family response regulator
MPIMDGRQFLEELKPSQREKYAIVVCSNTSEDEIIRMVTQLGAMEVVLKASLDPSGLLILVASYMQSRTST